MFLDLLAPEDLDRLCAAFRHVFSYDRFKETLQLRLGRRLEDISSPNTRFRTVVFEVVTAAHSEGWLDKLVQAAKEEFPLNERFATLCDEILEKLKQQRDLPNPTRPGPSIRMRNVLLVLAIALVLTIWMWVLGTATAVYGLLGAFGGWVATLVAQAGLRLPFIRWLDRQICRIADSPITTVLGGLVAILLFLASFSIGTVDVRWDAPEQVKFDFYDANAAPQQPPVWEYRSDGDTNLQWFWLGLFGKRQLSVQRSGYQDVLKSLAPWRSVPVGSIDFKRLPYLLLMASDALISEIPTQQPWRMLLCADGVKSVAKNYKGQPVWIGDHSPVVPEVPADFKEHSAFRRGAPIWPVPSVKLRPKTVVQIQLERRDDRDQWSEYFGSPIEFEGFDPAGLSDSLRKAILNDD